MNKIISIICCILIFGCKSQKEDISKELIIVGTVHFPTAGINVDSIYQAIKKVKPEVILMERDSVGFDSSFNRITEYEENEDQAISKYLKDSPNTILRPIEFEGRNEYRVKMGLYPQANEVYQKLNQLTKSNSFNKKEQELLNNFAKYWIKLDSLSATSLKAINTANSDKILDSAKYYQYSLTKKIVIEHKEFDELMEDAKGDSISLEDYFIKWEKFEHYDRNNAMVNNIIKTMKSLPNKKYLLLVGYHHRYFIKKALEKNTEDFSITEYYE